MSRAILLAGPLVLLAGCAASAEPRDAVPPPVITQLPDDSCGIARVERHIGAHLTDALRAEIRADRDERGVRFIAPGSAVTQDYRPDRLNVTLDAQGRIARLGCG